MALRETLEAVEQQQQDAAAEQHFRRVLVQIYEKYGYDRHSANDAGILDLCDGDKWEVTLQNFEFLRDNNQEAIDARLASKTPLKDQQERVIDEIISLLVGTRDAWGLDQERKRLRRDSRYDLNWLIGRRDELVRIRAAEKSSVAELAKQIKPAPLGYPKIPSSYVRPGTIRAVPVDRDFLINLSNTDPEAFRRWCKIYSFEAVNSLLAS
jgi:hypothetical protein